MEQLQKIDRANRLYWNSYYGSSRAPRWPSQFATFVMGEIPSGGTVIDIGCGGGRDATFFALQGVETIGVDASQAAITNCNSIRDDLGIPNLRYICAEIDDPTLPAALEAAADPSRARVIYARFFLHAIDDAANHAFFRLSDQLCRAGDVLALEYRTLKDAHLPKTTATHYRRYLDPIEIITLSAKLGFESRYFVEGFGMAKFGSDDAHVARSILVKTGS